MLLAIAGGTIEHMMLVQLGESIQKIKGVGNREEEN
jgi:hypothetical protein